MKSLVTPPAYPPCRGVTDGEQRSPPWVVIVEPTRPHHRVGDTNLAQQKQQRSPGEKREPDLLEPRTYVCSNSTSRLRRLKLRDTGKTARSKSTSELIVLSPRLSKRGKREHHANGVVNNGRRWLRTRAAPDIVCSAEKEGRQDPPGHQGNDGALEGLVSSTETKRYP